MVLAMAGAAMVSAVPSYALDADRYASESKLARGTWVKVKVSGVGMHVISDSQLRQMGFSDPAKVHVYGTGGRQVSFGLTEDMPDDLPLQPSVHTSKGITFFAFDHFTWSRNIDGSDTPYTHTIHAFCDDNYYFLSDVETSQSIADSDNTTAEAGENVISDYICRSVYEQDLEYAGESGSQIYGEDFRSKRTQSFDLSRIDAIDSDMTVKVRFAAKTTGGTSRLSFKANGESVETSETDKIDSSSAQQYCKVTETTKKLSNLNGNVKYDITYSPTGVLFMARLDYIESFYRRALRLDNGELYFYGTYNSGETLSVSGCSSACEVWDITDAARATKVSYTLQGDKAMWSLTSGGYREYVVFDPDKISRTATPAGSIANQNIHGMETPDMLIITLPEYKEGAEKIAQHHRDYDGFRVAVCDAEQLYNEFSNGKKDVGAFRKALKMWYDRGNKEVTTDEDVETPEKHHIRYCLLMGKPFYDNKMVSAAAKSAGYTPMPIYQSYTGLSETESYSNDDLIGMLEDVTESQFSMSQATLNVAVGRLPVTSKQEALDMAAKVENYVTNPTYGPWRNRVMLIADDDDNGEHLNQSQDVYAGLRSTERGAAVVYDRNYLDTYQRVMTGVGATYPQATERMLRNYNDGVILTNYIGHASAIGWGHEHLWEWEDIISMSNKNLTFIYAATCGFAYWDELSVSGAEHILLNPKSGVIGLMAATRTVYVFNNGKLNKATSSHFFERGEDGKALRLGDVYIRGKNDYHSSNNLRYAFLGDPAIRVPISDYAVEVTTINGEDVTDPKSKMPELTAMSTATIEGTVNKPDGEIDTEFNGTINLQLYDAERVVTTYGQGQSGKVISYNDHDRRLTTANAEVKEGHWSVTLHLPPEIEGNYTPALMAGYAYDGKGKEGNGVFERFYVYGYNDAEITDVEPPLIAEYYVNSANFENGGLVNANPVVFARLQDISGINISDSGIGHSMTLTVDGKDIYSDLGNYYEQDVTDPEWGTLVYPLQGISSGRHTLQLTVWDNANNVSKATIEINVGAMIDPTIYDIYAFKGDASVDFRILTDRPNSEMKCSIVIYDLSGRRIKSIVEDVTSDINSQIDTVWDMCDEAGTRVARGIYIYRATLETPEGSYSSKTKKLAISAPIK